MRSEAAATIQTVDPTDLNDVVKMMMIEEIDTFLSKITHGQIKTIFLGNNMHIMMQPPGLSVVNSHTEVATGSRQIAVIMKNLMAILITIVKGIKFTQVVAANALP